MTISIDDLELAAAPGWRAREEDRLGDWLLRAAAGFTGRANSALAAGDPGLPLAAAIAEVCRWYSERGLPAMIAVPYPSGEPCTSPIDRALADLGWAVRADAATVMTAGVPAVAAHAGTAGAGGAAGTAGAAGTGGVAGAAGTGGVAGVAKIAIDAEPDAAWLARYHYRGQQLPPVAIKLLTSAPWQAFGSVRTGGETVAIGRVAHSGDWAGLTAIEVDPRFRRQGLGAAVTGALAAAAARRGASNIYLQVTDGNVAARALYRRLGFTDHHGYHYRVAPA